MLFGRNIYSILYHAVLSRSMEGNVKMTGAASVSTSKHIEARDDLHTKLFKT